MINIKEFKNMSIAQLENRKNRTRKNIKMFLNEGNYQVAEIYNRELLSIKKNIQEKKSEQTSRELFETFVKSRF